MTISKLNRYQMSRSQKGRTTRYRLDQFLTSHSEPVLLVTDSNGRREVVIELLTRHGMTPTSVDSWQTFRAQQPSFGIAVAQLEDGYHLPDACLLLTEQELFGEHVLQQRHRQQQKDASSELVVEVSQNSELVRRLFISTTA